MFLSWLVLCDCLITSGGKDETLFGSFSRLWRTSAAHTVLSYSCTVLSLDSLLKNWPWGYHLTGWVFCEVIDRRIKYGMSPLNNAHCQRQRLGHDPAFSFPIFHKPTETLESYDLVGIGNRCDSVLFESAILVCKLGSCCVNKLLQTLY